MRGMSVREIQGHLLELYGLEVSPDLISTVTDAVLETVAEWQNRPLETSHPLVFFDAPSGFSCPHKVKFIPRSASRRTVRIPVTTFCSHRSPPIGPGLTAACARM